METREELMQAYKQSASGVLVRETPGIIDPYSADPARRFVKIGPYGWLRGILLVPDHPLPNMDASSPYSLSAILSTEPGAPPTACSFRVQQICEAVGGWDVFTSSPGERPLLR